ncbi:MAG: PIN domain nuclease [Cyclobacteriaceae bacterium]|nr:PIN domain nuclease [Cyclobacteriaceae bacterium]
MIIDSSVWINYLTGRNTKETELLDRLLSRGIQQQICPPILQEVLQGIREEKDFESTREILFQMIFLNLDPYFAAEGASKIYRALRKKGVTIEKGNDCLIAFYAIHFDLDLVHNDRDFDKIAKHTSLKIYST